MSSVVDIEQAIQKLPPAELVKFREWFAQFDAAQWDEQFHDDATSGRLDQLGEEALADLREGRTTEL